MRIPALLLLLAAPALADGAILEPVGATLAEFGVKLHGGEVRVESPEALGRSFLRLRNDQRLVSARYRDFFQSEHVRILRRYYARDLVSRQERDYAARTPPPAGPAGRFLGVKADGPGRAVVSLRLRARVVRLHAFQEGESWRVARILDEQADGSFQERGLGVPPLLAEPAEPAPAVRADLSTANATMRSLQADIRRLDGLAARARGALYSHYFAILGAFYGAERVEKARGEQKAAKPDIPHGFRLNPRTQRRGKMIRIAALAFERIPGAREESIIGQAAFDLEADAKGHWRIVAEWARPDPTKPIAPQAPPFGLFFLG